MRIALIACVKSKQPHPTRASELYTSALFKSAVRYAEANADKWYVLSAKHGLVSPRKVIAPYEQTLKTASRAERRAWAAQVQRQLARSLPHRAEVMMLAGEDYRRDLVPFLKERGHDVTTPFEGMRLGEQLRALSSFSSAGRGRPIERDLNRFYAALHELAALPGQGLPLGECHGRMQWPERGVYFFVEPGEFRANGTDLRVTRVGTHAVSIGARSTLWARLRAHRGASTGAGNHRGSVFRRHVGIAMMKRGLGKVASVGTWGVGSNATRAIRAEEAALESKVTNYLAQTRVVWIDVPDAAGRESKRSFIERNAIALLSNQLNPFDRPGKTWLGCKSDREEIRKSGLWNVDFVRENYDPAFLQELERCIARTAAASGPA